MRKTTKADRGPGSEPVRSHEGSLFRPLTSSKQFLSAHAAATSGRAESSISSPGATDILEMDSEAGKEWKKLSRLFFWLDKFDYKTITTQLQPNDPKLESPCAKACAFFQFLMVRLEAVAPTMNGKSLHEDALKIYLVAFQWVSHRLIDLLTTPSGTFHQLTEEEVATVKTLVKQREVLNDFLLLLLQDRKTSLVLQQHDNAILQIIRKTVGTMQERLSLLAQALDVQSTILFFYFHFQSVAMLAAYNENRKFMKNSAFDGFKVTFELLERSLGMSLSSFVFQEIYDTPLAVTEEWIPWKGPCLRAAVRFGKKKLSMVRISPDPAFTLRFANLYYLYKIAQLLISRRIFSLEERTMETLSSTLKCNADALSLRIGNPTTIPSARAPTESLLNENIVCLKFIKAALATVDDPLGLLEKLGLNRYLRPVLQSHVSAAIAGELYIFLPKTEGNTAADREKLVQYFALSKGHGYIAKVFKFITQMKYTEYQLAKAIKYPMAAFADDLAIELVSYVGKGLESRHTGVVLLQKYLAEYLCDMRSPPEPQLAERLLKVIESPVFNFLAPVSLGDDKCRASDELIEDLKSTSAGKLISLLNRIAWGDLKCANAILSYILGWVKLGTLGSEQLFGIYKLIFELIHGAAESTNDRLEGILLGKVLLMSIEADTKLLGEALASGNNAPLLAVVGNKGTLLLVSELTGAYGKLRSDPSLAASVTLTENMLLYLHAVPGVADTALGSSGALRLLLDAALTLERLEDEFLKKFVQSLLQCGSATARPGGYIPMIVLRFACEALDRGKRQPLVFQCLQMLMGFLDSLPTEELRPNQKALWEGGAVGLMLQSVETSEEYY